MAAISHEEHVAPRVDAFRNFIGQVCEQISASLCAEFEREVIQMSEDVIMYRGELAKCADLLAFQLGKEKQYHNMLENIAGNTSSLIGKSQEMGQKHMATEPLRDQMQAIMDQLFDTHKEAHMGHSSIHDDHRNMVESHLMTSAQLQNQSEAVQAELDSIMRVLSVPVVSYNKAVNIPRPSAPGPMNVSPPMARSPGQNPQSPLQQSPGNLGGNVGSPRKSAVAPGASVQTMSGYGKRTSGGGLGGLPGGFSNRQLA
eukprot:symbB.v1.2.009084.t1/scaffold567.1/size186458/6